MAVIYGLVFSQTGRTYVGCTKNKPAKRLREHRCLLRAGKHACSGLQKDWLEFGEAAFHLEILEDLGHNVTVDVKRKAELKWIDKKEAEGLLYNENKMCFALTPEAMHKGVEAAKHVVGNRWSAEANEKRRLATKGKKLNHGWKISATKRAKRAAAIAEGLMR